MKGRKSEREQNNLRAVAERAMEVHGERSTNDCCRLHFVARLHVYIGFNLTGVQSILPPDRHAHRIGDDGADAADRDGLGDAARDPLVGHPPAQEAQQHQRHGGGEDRQVEGGLIGVAQEIGHQRNGAEEQERQEGRQPVQRRVAAGGVGMPISCCIMKSASSSGLRW